MQTAPTSRSALAIRRVSAIRCRGFKRGVAQLGSALRSGRRGRGFKSRHPDHVTFQDRRMCSRALDALPMTGLGLPAGTTDDADKIFDVGLFDSKIDHLSLIGDALDQ
jgi:hypothetical protein